MWDRQEINEQTNTPEVLSLIHIFQKDLEQNNIHGEEAVEREVFRAKVLKMEGVQGCLLYTSRCV